MQSHWRLATKKAASLSSPSLFARFPLASGCGCNFFAVFVARLAHAATGSWSLAFGIVIADPDRGREDAERDALIAFHLLWDVAARAHGPLGAILSVAAVGPILAIGALRAIVPVGTLGALRALAILTVAVLAITVAARRGALLLAVVVRFTVGTGHFIVAILVTLVAARALILLLEARAAVFEHTEIMVGELEVIFGLHAIAGELHVARQRLVFFEQLGGVAALAIVLAVAVRTAGNTLGTLSTTTATAAALTIVDQKSCSLSHRAPHSREGP